MSFPFTVINPAVISRSASRREHTPEAATNLFSRTISSPVFPPAALLPPRAGDFSL